MGRVVGIDLGTTNSVVAVMEGGKPVVIANAEGLRTTPSYVGVSKDGERLVGQMARRQAILDPQNTFYAVKRLMGNKYSELRDDAKQVPYTVRRDDRGNIKVKCPRLDRDFAPEELSAMILRKLADEAGRYLGEPVTGAVITVPAYFNDSQRQATRDAGRIAGLEVKRILNEPTAASLAYGLDRSQSETVLVFDLGGGTFDVSVLEVGDGVFEVCSTSGDTQLGGVDFDKKIVDWLAEAFLSEHSIDLRKDRQALQRLAEAAEKAKIELSGVGVTEINLPFITAGEDGPKHIETRLTRSQFEEMCDDLMLRLREPVKQAVRDAGFGPADIDEVVLVGGGTRMPMVQDLVRGLIRREPNQNVNPDEVVAIGAAIQAGILGGVLKDILLLDVTPVSIGLETIGGLMKKIVPRNTTIPVRRTDVFSTSEDNQTSVEVNVVQGEREMASGNKTLGRFKLMGIPPAPRGIPQVQVSFDIDANGILQVTAMDRTTGREQSITIQGASTLDEEEVRMMMKEAEEFAESDRLRKEKIEKRNRAETLTFQCERQLRESTLDFGMQFVSPYRNRIEPLIKRLREALADNDDRRIDVAEADLRDALYDLQREVYDRNQEEKKEGGFLNAVKEFFLDEEDDYYDSGRNPYDYNRGGYALGSSDPYGTGGYNPYNPNPYGNAGRGPNGPNDYGGQGNSNNNYGQGNSNNNYGQGNSNNNYGQGNNYGRGNDFGRGSDRADNYGRQDNYGNSRSDNYGRQDNYDRQNNNYDRGGSNRQDSGQNNSGQNKPGRDGSGRDNYSQNNSGQNNSGRDSYGRDGSGQNDYGRDSYGQDSYGQDSGRDRPSRNRPPSRPDYSRDNWDDEDEWM